jgi:hypothetical protein
VSRTSPGASFPAAKASETFSIPVSFIAAVGRVAEADG